MAAVPVGRLTVPGSAADLLWTVTSILTNVTVLSYIRLSNFLGMSRGHWIGESIQTEVPETLGVLAALLTRLGDPVFLACLLFVLYWKTGRAEWISVIGLALSGVGLVLALKYSFALPRPPQSPSAADSVPVVLQSLYDSAVTADGYGFPSGHAMGSTIVYALIARTLDVGPKRVRYALGAVLVVIISLTRVVLGVHYLVDVLAGIVLGVLFVIAAQWVLGRAQTDRETTALVLGVTIGGCALVISPESPDTSLHLGLAIGAFTGWQVVLLDRLTGDGPDRSNEQAPFPHSYRATLALLGVIAICGVLVAALTGPMAPIDGFAGIAIAGAVAIPGLWRSWSANDRSSSCIWYTRRVRVELDALTGQLGRQEFVYVARPVFRLTALLYVVPALIAIESFSEPVELPSLVVDLLDVPFAVLVAAPVDVVKQVTVGPLGLEWLFSVPAMTEALVLVMLFVAYYLCSVVLYNGSQFLASLPVPEGDSHEREQRTQEPNRSGSESSGKDAVRSVDSNSRN